MIRFCMIYIVVYIFNILNIIVSENLPDINNNRTNLHTLVNSYLENIDCSNNRQMSRERICMCQCLNRGRTEVENPNVLDYAYTNVLLSQITTSCTTRMEYLPRDEHGCYCGCLAGTDPAKEKKIESPIPETGSFSRAYQNFMEFMSNKDETTFRAVMENAHEIFTQAIAGGQMLWLGNPLSSYIFQRTWIWSELEVIDPKRYSAFDDIRRLYKIAKHRKELLTPNEVNLWGRTDLLFNEQGGTNLEKLVDEVGTYYYDHGNGTKLLEQVFNAFRAPFENTIDQLQTKLLLNNINDALRLRD